MTSILEEIEAKIIKIKEAQDEIIKVNTTNLEFINSTIEEITYKLRVEAATIDTSGFKPSFIFDLPDNLRKTIRALMDVGEATAEEICLITKRSRSLESSYLNSLTTMGYVEKKRIGQLVYYKIKFK